jgi:ubiquinone/menaquinone biosynthesis C-methylase UbiE
MALTYANETFDFVFTSETLEHVPDLGAALAEIRRVLVRGGAHIFTVPVINDRPTRQRAALIDNEVHYYLPPSFHGRMGTSSPDRLVFYEFGRDTRELIERCGFTVRYVQDNKNPALVTIVAIRTD